MVQLGLGVKIEDATRMVNENLANGKALQKFLEMVEAQGGNISGLRVSKNVQQIPSTKSGHIIDMNAYKFGKLSLDLGGGRVTKEDKIDPSVGIVLRKKIGDNVKVGDILCTLYLKEDAAPITEDLTSYYTFEEIVDNKKDNTTIESTVVSDNEDTSEIL